MRNAVIAGEGDQEVQILRQRLAYAPESIEIRMALADRYEAAGFPDLALEHVRMARARDLKKEDLAIREAALLAKLELPEAAAQVLLDFARQNAEASSAAYSWAGIHLDLADKLKDGEAAHREAISRAPKSDSLHNNLGYNLLQQKRYGEASKEFEAALALNRHSVTARSNLARVLAERPDRPDTTGAVAHWTSAVDAAAAHNNLAASYIETGQYPKAREELSLALTYRRAYGPALQNLELLSGLDGGSSAVQLEPKTSAWQRLKDAMRQAFVQTEEMPASSRKSGKKPAERASR